MSETIKKILEIMENKGVSRQELSDRTLLNYKSICNWLHGTYVPNIEIVEEMLDALGMEIQICEKMER